MVDDRDSDFYNGWIEDEEYHCEKCGKVFSMRVQNDGKYDYDEGTGTCDICWKSFCAECTSWYQFGGRYTRICKNCFDEKMLDKFAYWYELFMDEYCHSECDDCPFFFKKGCMMRLLNNLVDIAFHTEEVKKIELERLQRSNRQAEKEWEKRLQEANVRPRKK